MPLTWDTSKIEDRSVCTIKAEYDSAERGVKVGDEIWNPVTTALVWHSLNTGIGTITAENAAEVYARIKLVETLFGASLLSAEGPKPITFEDVRAHIGLSTNASYKTEARTAFLKRHAGAFMDDTVSACQRTLAASS